MPFWTNCVPATEASRQQPRHKKKTAKQVSSPATCSRNTHVQISSSPTPQDASMAARSAAAASTKANSSQHRADPSKHDDHRADAPQEPRALRDWKWRKDPEAVNNPCYKGDGLGGTGYVNLREGDLVWTGQCPGTPPKPRSDGIPWRFGLNLQTARSGWFPCSFAIKPAKQFTLSN